MSSLDLIIVHEWIHLAVQRLGGARILNGKFSQLSLLIRIICSALNGRKLKNKPSLNGRERPRIEGDEIDYDDDDDGDHYDSDRLKSFAQ